MIFRPFCLLLASSYGYAIIIIASFLFKPTVAEYDCSAKEDGWYYDPEFCHIYWRCIHGASEEFECASGTAWDHQESRCNWLDSVDCTRAERTTERIASDDGDDEPDEDNTDSKEDDSDRTTKKTQGKSRSVKLSNSRRMADDDEDYDDREALKHVLVHDISTA